MILCFTQQRIERLIKDGEKLLITMIVLTAQQQTIPRFHSGFNAIGLHG